MCQAKPGFRCSAHTRAELDKSKEQLQYELTKYDDTPHLALDMASKSFTMTQLKYEKSLMEYAGTRQGYNYFNGQREALVKKMRVDERTGKGVDKNDIKNLQHFTDILKKATDNHHNTADLNDVTKGFNRDPRTMVRALKSSRIDHDSAMRILQKAKTTEQMKDFRVNLAQNKFIEQKTLHALVESYQFNSSKNSELEAKHLAKNPKLTPSDQISLMNKVPQNSPIRYALTLNPNLSNQAKKVLLEKDDHGLHADNIVEHKVSNSTSIIEKLSNNKRGTFLFLANLAENKNISSLTLNRIVQNTVKDKQSKTPFNRSERNTIFKSVVQNEKTLKETLLTIESNTKDPQLLSQIKSHKNY